MGKKYWLLKSEPSAYGIEDLAKESGQTTHWDGIRNYQARNIMRDEMEPGQLAFFYHSNAPETGVVGIVEIVRSAYPDHTAFDPKSKYHDPKSNPDDPRWLMVDVRLRETFPRTITLQELRDVPGLDDMMLLRRGARLSIQPVSPEEWEIIVKRAAD
jgi:predicted RNA-binding protein with PUA-like domain